MDACIGLPPQPRWAPRTIACTTGRLFASYAVKAGMRPRRTWMDRPGGAQRQIFVRIARVRRLRQLGPAVFRSFFALDAIKILNENEGVNCHSRTIFGFGAISAICLAALLLVLGSGPPPATAQEPRWCWDCNLRYCPGIGQTPDGNVIDWRCDMQQWTSTYCCANMWVHNPQADCLGGRPCAAECRWTDEFGLPQHTCITCGRCFDIEE
jgi:hypothetical protein